jgi:superfamily II DNA or RNA helicase
MTYTLRPYQRDAVNALFDYFAEHDGNAILSLPTAAGKSIIQAAFIQKTLAMWPSERFLLVSHVKEILTQDADKIQALMPDVTVGIYSAGLGKKETGYQVTIAGIQSVYKRAHEMGNISIVIVDECHLVGKTGDTMYQKFLSALQQFCPQVKIIGLSATPYRLDSGPLIKGDNRIFTDIAYSITIKELINLGFLSPLVTAPTRSRANVSDVKKRGGEYITGDLEKVMNQTNIIEAALNEVDTLCVGRKSWLVFCVGVDHARDVAQAIRMHGHSAEVVVGDTPKVARADRLKRFKAGEIKALVSVGVLSTGFDAPCADALICLRPTLSPGLWCLDSKTEILTSHGWMSMGNVKKGDCALTRNMNTGAGCWSSVLSVINRSMRLDEKWVEYTAPRANFRVTDQHRMIFKTKSKGKWSDWKIDSAINMASQKAGILMPTAVAIDQPGVPLTDDELYLIGMIITDGSLTTHQVNIYQSERHPEIIERIEKAMNGIGLAWKKNRQWSQPGSYQERYPRWRYWICAGDPRMNRPGKGIRYLYPFLDKDLSPILMALSRPQFFALLRGVFDGDGAKKKGVDYIPRSWTICSARKIMIERLQSLAVMHGCTAHLRSESHGRANPIWIMTITPKDWRSVGGYHRSVRPQVTISNATNETVWCVQTETGTIVTRRNGKVTVMGNCQIVGRVTRLHPGKKNGLVLDFTDNLHTHGPVDLIDIDGDGNVKTSPYRVCPECGKLIPPQAKACECGYSFERECHKCHGLFDRDLKVCPNCGAFVPGRPRKIDHNTEATDGQILSDGYGLVTEPIDSIETKLHTKEDKPDSMKVTYRGANFPYSSWNEWLCFDHSGYPARKAAQRWVRLDGRVPTPQSVSEALERSDELVAPKEIRLQKEGKYWRVL